MKGNKSRMPLWALLVFGLLLLVACEDGSSPATEDPASYHDPGRGPFEEVATEDLVGRCGLDPDILASIDASINYPYAIVRYGLLCHEHYPDDAEAGPEVMSENFSVTKTMAGAVFGRAVKLSAELEYPLRDTDRMDSWVDDITFNPDARVAHVLGMVAHNENLEFGSREFSYDTYGNIQINKLSEVIEAVIAQDPEEFEGVQTSAEFADRFFFEPLGMDHSEWSGYYFAFGWISNLRDMARLGLLLVHDGVYDNQAILSEDWVYKMTHPSFEDANTGYGYLTWLGASNFYKVPGGYPYYLFEPFGECEPPALWPEYPHGLSDSPDCGYRGVYPCEQDFDVGVFSANGGVGNIILGHPALDLVLVAKDAEGGLFISGLWDLIRPALVEHDPVYQGDMEAFCRDYAAGAYAPDLIPLP